MQIVDGQTVLDEDDHAFLFEMGMLGLIDENNPISTLRSIARAWYERGYYDRVDEESAG